LTITAYRVCRKQYAATMWSGAGARDYGGRWNSKGVAVVYASESRSLAAMEQLVQMLPRRVLDGFVVASIRFDERQMRALVAARLPRHWREPVAPPSLRRCGDEWIALGESAVLAVPSAVVAGERNYLINPAHPEFAAMIRSKPTPFTFDPRLK
jgi:RES domain-containing protein